MGMSNNNKSPQRHLQQDTGDDEPDEELRSIVNDYTELLTYMDSPRMKVNPKVDAKAAALKALMFTENHNNSRNRDNSQPQLLPKPKSTLQVDAQKKAKGKTQASKTGKKDKKNKKDKRAGGKAKKESNPEAMHAVAMRHKVRNVL